MNGMMEDGEGFPFFITNYGPREIIVDKEFNENDLEIFKAEGIAQQKKTYLFG
jgi:hypothetical protein